MHQWLHIYLKGWIQYFWRKKTFLDIQDFSLWGKYNWTFLYEFRALWAALVTASLCSSASSSKTVVEIVEWHRHNQRQLLSCWRNAVQSSSSSAAVLAEHLQCSVLVDRYIAQIFVPIKVLILLGSPPLLLNYSPDRVKIWRIFCLAFYYVVCVTSIWDFDFITYTHDEFLHIFVTKYVVCICWVHTHSGLEMEK